MTEPFRDLDELRGLLDLLCEEKLPADQMSRLEELVLAHPEAEGFYVQYMSLHANLSQHFAVLPSTSVRSLRGRINATLSARSRRRRGKAVAWAGIAAGLLLAVFFLQPRSNEPERVAAADEERLDTAPSCCVPQGVWDLSEPSAQAAPAQICLRWLKSGAL